MNSFTKVICFLFLLLKTTHLLATPFESENSFTPAKLIPKSHNVKEVPHATRLEGWVYMSYIVDVDGKTKDIEILAYSTKGANLHHAYKRVESLRYEAALYKGKPVESAKTYLLKHTISFYGSNNEGISTGYRYGFNRVDKYLQTKEFTKAKSELDQLNEDHSKNLTEQALTAWLYSNYYASQKDWSNYGEMVQIANHLREMLPTKMAIKNSQNLLSYYEFTQQYADAVNTVYKMKNIKNAEIKPDTIKAMILPLSKKLNSSVAIKIEANLKKDIAWQYSVGRKVLSVKVEQGKLDSAQFRCTNVVYNIEMDNLNSIVIPNDFHNCSFLLKGAEGSKIIITEKNQTQLL
ncbi:MULTISPECIES: energy transducer TonB [unclassified Pseudoalteromonas]|uniref:energy transducer TonB n=1 Tax=unclassified Pseudoalteromonas TaxID=194690 RepID=UPI0005A6373C|nr:MULTISPECIES: hypothetical protein [unclassified Pseudoalteromonas]